MSDICKNCGQSKGMHNKANRGNSLYCLTGSTMFEVTPPKPAEAVQEMERCSVCRQPKNNGWNHAANRGYGDFASVSCSPSNEPKPAPQEIVEEMRKIAIDALNKGPFEYSQPALQVAPTVLAEDKARTDARLNSQETFVVQDLLDEIHSLERQLSTAKSQPLPPRSEKFFYEDSEVLAAVENTDHAKDAIKNKLCHMTGNQKASLYRAVVKLHGGKSQSLPVVEKPEYIVSDSQLEAHAEKENWMVTAQMAREIQKWRKLSAEKETGR